MCQFVMNISGAIRCSMLQAIALYTHLPLTFEKLPLFTLLQIRTFAVKFRPRLRMSLSHDATLVDGHNTRYATLSVSRNEIVT